MKPHLIKYILSKSCCAHTRELRCIRPASLLQFQNNLYRTYSTMKILHTN